MSYQTLAQKYRPQTFDEVCGQDSVIRTLNNAVKRERIANAYIFCGPRGVGKTTIARLLAKILNCTKPSGDDPCNKCDSCLEITQGNNMDVLEIDGASNNSVDEIRTLRENVKFSPSKGKYKIYIIDEVHMLSQGAFNALLKTLEEPPPHVKFIFATTEAQKVLPTIISRCQRFDFRKISPRTISDRLVDIAKKENIKIDEDSVLLIARSSDGSLRDAQVVLDQMISYSGKEIVLNDVVELLGVVHRDSMMNLSAAIIKQDPGKVTILVDETISEGKDPVFIVNSLIAHFRDLMVLKLTGAQTSDMVFTKEELETLKNQVADVSLEEILYVLQNLSYCLILMKGTVSERVPLEMTLIKIAHRKAILPLDKVLEKLEKIKKSPSISGGGISDSGSGIPPTSNNTPPAGGESRLNSLVHRETREAVQIEESVEGGVQFPEIHGNWKAILNYIRNKKMSVYTFLNTAKPIEIGKDKVVVGFGKECAFNKEVLEAEDNKNVIKEAVKKITGNDVIINFTLLDFLSEKVESEEEKTAAKKQMNEEMKPVIDKAMDVFGGHVIRDFVENGR